MSAATIVFMDVVGFSRKPTAEQQRLVEGFTDEVVRNLRTLLNPAFQMPEVLALPTGDGMALVFLHTTPRRWSLRTLYTLIHALQQWSLERTTPHAEVALRFGMHVGTVEIITDINGRPNVCGDTINYAQRIMDAANPRQVLMSEAAYREYFGIERTEYSDEPFSAAHPIRIVGPLQVVAKHGWQIPVYKMVSEPETPGWNNEDPVTKNLLLVSLTPLPKEIAGSSFAERLQRAHAIALIQLGGERLLQDLQTDVLKLSETLRRFWVFMPDPATYETFAMGRLYITVESLRQSLAAWTEYLQRLHDHSPTIQVKLGLYRVPPLWGGSFMDWDRRGGTIHISPYLWNRAARDCPGYDLQWLTETPSAVYEAYVDTLDWLHNQVQNILPEGRT